MNCKAFFFFIFLTSLLAACSPQGLLLNEDQVSRLITREKEFNWVFRGFSGTLLLSQDGSAKLRVKGLGDDEGKWHQVDNKICVQFEKAIQAQKRCAYAFKLPNGTYEAWQREDGVKMGLFYPVSQKD